MSDFYAAGAVVVGSFGPVPNASNVLGPITDPVAVWCTLDGAAVAGAPAIVFGSPIGNRTPYSTTAPAANGNYMPVLTSGTDGSRSVAGAAGQEITVGYAPETPNTATNCQWPSFLICSLQCAGTVSDGTAFSLIARISSVYGNYPAWILSGDNPNQSGNLNWTGSLFTLQVTDATPDAGGSFAASAPYVLGPWTVIPAGQSALTSITVIPLAEADSAGNPTGVPQDSAGVGTLLTAVGNVPTAVAAMLLAAGLAKYITGSSGPLQWTAAALALAPHTSINIATTETSVVSGT